MALYIRLRTNFYSHRKTAKLRSILGDDALWIPPRIWTYAAEHQPDGNLSSYSSNELAMLIGCEKHCLKLKEALLEAGFLDADGMLHGWDEHNSYHQTYKDRAAKAAAARWADKEPGSGNDSTGKDKKGIDPSIALLAASNASSIYEAYPRKVGKDQAIKSILKALKSNNFEFLMERTKLFAQASAGSDEQFIPYPATWFNQQRFNDDPESWYPKPSTPKVKRFFQP